MGEVWLRKGSYSELGAAGYPAFVATAKAEASVVIDGKTVTFENATEPEEFAALQAQVSSKFYRTVCWY